MSKLRECRSFAFHACSVLACIFFFYILGVISLFTESQRSITVGVSWRAIIWLFKSKNIDDFNSMYYAQE